MSKPDRPLLAMLNYLDEPHEADAFVALVIDDVQTGDVRVSGYEICRAMADLGQLANLKGRDATRMAAETVVGSFLQDDHEEALKAAVALCHFAQNSYLVVHATFTDGDEFTALSLKAIHAPDVQSATDLLQDYSMAASKSARNGSH